MRTSGRNARWKAVVAALLTAIAFPIPSTVFAAQPPAASGSGVPEAAPELRVEWHGSRFQGTPEPPLPYRLRRVFPSRAYSNPTVLTNAPGTQRLFVAELNGKLYSFDPRDETDRRSTDDAGPGDLLIDLRAAVGATQVYGLTFAPDFARSRVCYICYITERQAPDATRVSRFRVEDSDPPRIDPASEEIVLTWLSGGHNGGCLKFGPDGYLYVSTGDAGPAFPPDPLNSGQDVGNLLSAILRIDVSGTDGQRGYRVPPDNPFVDLDGARGEIWCYGLRNPWKMSFDRATGDLWVGDVGWELWELVYRVRPGDNYGWSLVEGRQAVHEERQRGPTPIVPPTVDHPHTEARSVTGGFVYRGTRLPELQGAYVYGDYVTGKIWALRMEDDEVSWHQELADSTIQIIAFGEDNDGELYVVDYISGALFVLEENPDRDRTVVFPSRLSQSGLFESAADYRLAAGVYAYDIQAEPWADGARADRFLAVPGRGQLTVFERNNDQLGEIRGFWRFPPDTVIGKTLSIELAAGERGNRRRVETQILHRDGENWRAYTYRWNEDQTDAELVSPDGFHEDFVVRDEANPQGRRTLSWRFAARTECLLCHTTRGGYVNGLTPPQLGSGVPESLDVLDQWVSIGLAERPDRAEVLCSPYDASADLERRARSYLHANCSHCHRRGGGGSAALELLHHLPLDRTRSLGERPTQGTFGIPDAQVIAPGDPYRSVLYYRLAKLGRGHMPQLGTTEVDPQGLRLIHDWIASMSSPAMPTDTAQALRDHHQRLLEAIVAAPGEDARTASVEELLESTSGALRLLALLESDDAPPELSREAIVPIGLNASHAEVRDLFLRYLDAPERPQTLGSRAGVEELLMLRGEADRGRVLFREASGVACRNCHRRDGVGRAVGPALDDLPTRLSRREILESLVEPSRRVDAPYRTWLVETSDGRILTGLLVSQNETFIILKTADNREVRMAQDDVELMQPQRRSLMPELLLQELTPQQAADLLEYLATPTVSGGQSDARTRSERTTSTPHNPSGERGMRN